MNKRLILGITMAVIVFSVTAVSLASAAPGGADPLKNIVEAIKAILERIVNLETQVTALFLRTQTLEAKTTDLQSQIDSIEECSDVEELCDGVDQLDCLGLTEDSLIQTCGSDVGECKKGLQFCESGSWGSCTGGIIPKAEVCDGFDNDCDGIVDEECEISHETICNDGIDNDDDATTDCDDTDCYASPACNLCGDGICGPGEDYLNCPADCFAPDADGDGYTSDVDCDDSNPEIHPGAIEVCDGVDDDCNSLIDDGVIVLADMCPSYGVGVCTDPSVTCESGAIMCDYGPQYGAEVCDGLDNDCDGIVDEEWNFLTDVNNCGACGNVCWVAHGTPQCNSGSCAILACNIGYGNCDMNYANGCEINLKSNLDNCGSCWNACPTVAHSVRTCTNGACGIACNVGYGNCNMNSADGCEIDLSTDAANCGACGHVCSIGQICIAGICSS